MGELHHFFTDHVPVGPVHDGEVGMSYKKCEVSIFLNFVTGIFVKILKVSKTLSFT